MSWTKRQLIEQAFAELALAGYDFDLSPEEMQGALVRLDSMIATWTSRGVRLSYAMPANPSDSDISIRSPASRTPRPRPCT
jgi:hypothetical protein